MADVSPRVQTAGGFLTSAVALAFVTLFIMVDAMRPALETGTTAAIAPLLADLYPFPAVTEVRIAYCIVALLPILLPLWTGKRVAAGAALILGTLVTLLNIEDAIAGYLLDGRPMLGALFAVAILLPSLVGLCGAWSWWRTVERAA